jgi:hypothetical protein
LSNISSMAAVVTIVMLGNWPFVVSRLGPTTLAGIGVLSLGGPVLCECRSMMMPRNCLLVISSGPIPHAESRGSPAWRQTDVFRSARSSLPSCIRYVTILGNRDHLIGVIARNFATPQWPHGPKEQVYADSVTIFSPLGACLRSAACQARNSCVNVPRIVFFDLC